MNRESRGEIKEFYARCARAQRIPMVEVDDEFEQIVYQVLANLVEGDEPDAYSVVGDDVYIIEHFQFNASRENRRGSSLSRKLAEANKNDSESITYIETESNAQNYVNNLIKHFENHAKKYDQYKANVQKIVGNEKNIKGLFFLIEDITLFGAVEVSELQPFKIILTTEFMNIWKQYDCVKCIVLAGRCQNEDYCEIYSNKCTEIKCDSINNKTIIIMNKAFQRTYTYEIKIQGDVKHG